MGKISSEEVLARIQEQQTLWKNIMKRRNTLTGHILRQEGDSVQLWKV